MSNGYGKAMTFLTKLSKVPFSQLGSTRHSYVGYVNDSYLQRDVLIHGCHSEIQSIGVFFSQGSNFLSQSELLNAIYSTNRIFSLI